MNQIADIMRNMDECGRIGIMGDCGFDCPVFQRGDCENTEEMLDSIEQNKVAVLFKLYVDGAIFDEQP